MEYNSKITRKWQENGKTITIEIVSKQDTMVYFWKECLIISW